MVVSIVRTSLLPGILILLLSNVSDGQLLTVVPDNGATVTLSTALPMVQCAVCVVENGTVLHCVTSLTLAANESVNLLFNCSDPPSAFNVQINQTIECSATSCSPAIGQTQPTLLPEFNRTFTWELSGPEKTPLSLDFLGGGLQRTTQSNACPDGYQYSVIRTKPSGGFQPQGYCRNGPVVHLDLPSHIAVSLQVPQNGDVLPSVFNVKPGAPKGQSTAVTPDSDTTITILREAKGPACQVSTDTGLSPSGSTSLKLLPAQNASVVFSCPQPQDAFRVEFKRDIVCNSTTCSGDIVQAASSLFPEFNRTFTWDFKVPASQAFLLNFPAPGMRQILPLESCPDQHTYTVITYQRSGPTTVGVFCRNGSISQVQVLYKGRLTLWVPGEKQLDATDVKVSVGPELKVIAVLKATLPRGSWNFFSANYPGSFPSREQMRWDFTVPPQHNFTVLFLSQVEPTCQSQAVTVEYQQEEGTLSVSKGLSGPQPAQRQGNFSMVLTNCEISKGVTALNFQVSVIRSSHPVLSTLDLRRERDLVLHIEKRNPGSYCEMSVNSTVVEKVSVASGTQCSLSFLDCLPEELLLTANKTIECQSLDTCAGKSTLLTVPILNTGLPTALQSVTWHFLLPEEGSVELLPVAGSLRQSLPTQECNGSVSLQVAEDDGAPVGIFCPGGVISSVLVHSNTSVTATATGGQDLNLMPQAFLNASFSQEISESVILTLSPAVNAPALLATPNWPGGMKPSSTVAWVISAPEQYTSDLQFVKVSRPVCAEGHAWITIQKLGSLEEVMGRREDEEVPDKLSVPSSFYLNMSNCVPEEGELTALSKVTLKEKSKLFLGIILGVVGAILLLVLVALAVVCVAIRKKKRKMSMESSIYVPKGNVFRPDDHPFPKSRRDNDSHVYTSIEDTMVYSHLLQNPGDDFFQGPRIDTYHTFTGPVDGNMTLDPQEKPANEEYRPFLDPSETFHPPRPHTPIGRQDSLFVDRRMVDNELYTFKSLGDINQIRLSTVELEPQPPVEYDSKETM